MITARTLRMLLRKIVQQNDPRKQVPEAPLPCFYHNNWEARIQIITTTKLLQRIEPEFVSYSLLGNLISILANCGTKSHFNGLRKRLMKISEHQQFVKFSQLKKTLGTSNAHAQSVRGMKIRQKIRFDENWHLDSKFELTRNLQNHASQNCVVTFVFLQQEHFSLPSQCTKGYVHFAYRLKRIVVKPVSVLRLLRKPPKTFWGTFWYKIFMVEKLFCNCFKTFILQMSSLKSAVSFHQISLCVHLWLILNIAFDKIGRVFINHRANPWNFFYVTKTLTNTNKMLRLMVKFWEPVMKVPQTLVHTTTHEWADQSHSIENYRNFQKH